MCGLKCASEPRMASLARARTACCCRAKPVLAGLWDLERPPCNSARSVLEQALFYSNMRWVPQPT